MAVTDTIFGARYLLVVGMTMIIGLFIWYSFQTAMVDTISGRPGEATMTEAMNNIRTSLEGMDYVFPLIIAGLMIVSIVFAFKTGASVVYGFISVIMWAFSLLIAAIFTNVFEVFGNTFPTVITQTPVIVWTFVNLKWIVLVWGVLISLVLFTRNKQEDAGITAAEARYYG